MRLQLCSMVLSLSLLSIDVAYSDIVDSIEDLEKDTKKPPVSPTSTPLLQPAGRTEVNSIEGKNPDLSSPDKDPKDRKPVKAKAAKDDRRRSPIHLQSDGTSTYSRNGSLVYLEKNVVITQDDVRIQSDEAKVKLGEKATDSNVQTVEMKGRVNLNRFSPDPSERITAKAEKALFENSSQRVILEGGARLWRDGHLIRGDKIVYEIETGMVKVDRVQGVVQPDKAKP